LYSRVYVILIAGVDADVLSLDSLVYFYIFGCEDTFFGESDFLLADSPFELEETFR
jgi:hypothetical protein